VKHARGVFALEGDQGRGVDDGVPTVHGAGHGSFVGHVPGDDLEFAGAVRAEDALHLLGAAHQKSWFMALLQQRTGEVRA
jgi:hypothetical protein